MKLIPLTQGKFAMVDDEDFEDLSRYKWCAHRWSNRPRAEDRWYAVRTVRNPDGPSRQRTLLMHVVVFGALHADHIDGDGLNNQRANLRPGSGSRNAQNRLSWGASRYKGVCLVKATGKWRAQICFGGNRVRSLGLFRIEEDAALAYDDAARELFGEWGTYNFPRPGERSALTGEIAT